MTKEQINGYTVRISQSSREELAVISCEAAVDYMKDALSALREDRKEDFFFYTKRAMAFVDNLSSALDMTYAIAGHLLSLYLYVKKILVHANAVVTDEGIEDAMRIMKSLGEAFAYAAKQEDNSEKVMQGSEQIYAGYTYGKNSRLNEYVVRDSQ